MKNKRSYRKPIKYGRTNKYKRSIKRKTKRKKSKKSPKKNYKLMGGMEPAPAPEPVSLNFRQYIEGLISEADSIDPQKIIEYLTSVGSVDGYSDKIAPPLLSRLGDIQIGDFKSLGMSFPEIFYSFINLLSQVSDKLPSVYDAIALDSKVHYMELLLENELCDDSTMILYYDINTGSELTDKRSLKTQENMKLLAGDGETTYYIKTPFAGASACAIQIESSVSTLEDLVGLIPESKYCIGRFYGLIIQKANPKFSNIHGEIRCCCFEGQIKSISSSYQGHSLFGFKVLGIDKSVFIKLLEKTDLSTDEHLSDPDIKQLYQSIYKSILNNDIGEDGNIVPSRYLWNEDMTPHHGGDFSGANSEEIIISEESVSKLSGKCNSAYSILKSGLDLEGSHHRIDLIKSRDSDTYIINEIENINFGSIPAESLRMFSLDEIELVKLIDYVGRGVPKDKFFGVIREDYSDINEKVFSLDIEIFKNILEHIDKTIRGINEMTLRDLLLLFD